MKEDRYTFLRSLNPYDLNDVARIDAAYREPSYRTSALDRRSAEEIRPVRLGVKTEHSDRR